jgi:hypothetical protein
VNDVIWRETEGVFDLLSNARRLGIGQVNLVEDGYHWEILFVRQIEVCNLRVNRSFVEMYGLSLYALRCIYNKQHTTTPVNKEKGWHTRKQPNWQQLHFENQHAYYKRLSRGGYPGVSIKFKRYSSPLCLYSMLAVCAFTVIPGMSQEVISSTSVSFHF